MICKKCGTENTGDSNFCTKCGGVLESTASNEVVEVNRGETKKIEIKSEDNQKNSRGKAIAGFICSLCGMLTCGISSVVGLILSIIGLSESRKRGETDGLAIAGIVFSSLFILIFLYAMIMAAISPEEPTTTPSTNSSQAEKSETSKQENNKVEVADFSSMPKEDIQNWCKNNGITCYFKEEHSDSVANGGFIKQDKTAGEKINKWATITVTYSLGKKPTIYQLNALEKAKSYSKLMHMSKKGIYDQLTSEYGEGFTAEEAQYAIEHLDVDYKLNALEKAKSYQNLMHMSKSGIYEQLTSEYGEGFTAEEAQYAIEHLED